MQTTIIPKDPPKRSLVPHDFMYLRYRDDAGKVVRVVKTDFNYVGVLALYPTEDSDVFHGEAFDEMDDNSPQSKVKRSEIDDKLWLGLLDNKKASEVLKGYKVYFHDTRKYGTKVYIDEKTEDTFRVVESKERA